MESESRYVVDDRFDRKTNQALNQFWIGFSIYTICYTLMISGVVSSKISYLQLLGLLIFIIPAVQLIRFKIENKYLQVIFSIYCGWLLFIIFRGFSFKSQYLFDTFIDAYYGLFAYLVLLVLLCPLNLVYLKKVVNVIIFLSVVYFFCDVIFIKTLLASDGEVSQKIVENFTKILAIPCGFVLLNIIYHKDKQNR